MRVVKKCVDWLFGLALLSPFIAWILCGRPFSDGSVSSDFTLNFFEFMNNGPFDSFCEALPWFEALDDFASTMNWSSGITYLVSFEFIVVLAWVVTRFLLWFPYFVVGLMDKVFEKGKGKI